MHLHVTIINFVCVCTYTCDCACVRVCLFCGHAHNCMTVYSVLNAYLWSPHKQVHVTVCELTFCLHFCISIKRKYTYTTKWGWCPTHQWTSLLPPHTNFYACTFDYIFTSNTLGPPADIVTIIWGLLLCHIAKIRPPTMCIELEHTRCGKCTSIHSFHYCVQAAYDCRVEQESVREW